MGGVISLRDQDVPQDEGCADIAHRQKLSAHEGKTFFALGVIRIWQSDIVGLEPIAGVERRRIAIDEGAVQLRSSWTVVMISQHFQFVRDQFSNPTWYVRFARWSCRVVLRNLGVEYAVVPGFPPGLSHAASRAKRFGDERVFLFFQKLRCRPPWILSPSV